MILVSRRIETAGFHLLRNFHRDGVTDICVGERERQGRYLGHNLDLRPGIGRFMSMDVDRLAHKYPIH